VQWFEDGSNRTYRIKYPNGTVDVFSGWVSSLGKAVTNKENITRTVKVTNSGKPSLAEDTTTPLLLLPARLSINRLRLWPWGQPRP
jgi:uncharacterized protein YjdB